jgi:VWFA-related protein
LAPLSAAGPVVREGLFSIDLVVADSAGNPVSDLAPWDFTLLDNGQPAKIRTLHNSLEASEPVPELIFVLDAINLSPQQLTQTESAIIHFLRRNNGHLEAACFLYRLTRDGLFSSSKHTRDGDMLAQEVEQHKSPRTVWKSGRNNELGSLGSWEARSQPNPLSLRALGSIAIDQREIAGRKVVVWISPGWPVNRGDIGFDEATEFSTRLREARITLDNVNVWPNPDQSFNYHDYLEAPRSQKDMQPAKLALQVIATHTGGLVLDSSGNLDRDIERCVEEERGFCTLTFNPPHTYRMDEFHDLRLQVARPALTVRAPTGYYNEPVYFDNPRPRIEKMTVAQLEDLVHSQTNLPRKLANLELTDRLSTPRLDALLREIHSEEERQALTADADLSLALAPPADEIVNRPLPPVQEQRAILQRTFDYLQNAIPKLPDFYALRDTVRFEEPPESDNEIWKMPHQDETLHFASSEHATVLYRNGHEVVEKKQKLGERRVVRGVRARDLETWGTFGPILAYVLTAAATSPSTLIWKRWERGKYGDLAVFSYRAASTDSAPEITYCCIPVGDGTTLYRNKADTYGEFAVNPDTGAIMRIVINADLDEERDPDVPLIRSQVMVEYGPVELGGKTYICPQQSVEISRGRSERELHEWGMVFSLYSYFETMINDVTFGGYHKFGSKARILPGFEETEGTKAPAPLKNAQPAIEEPGGPRLVTVAQLTEIVGRAKGKGDGKVAHAIEHLQLAERLSSPKLAMLSAELPGTKSKTALMAVVDASVFLDPPPDETPADTAPDLAEQTQMMARVVDYLKKMIPKLPDFYARRFTTSFEEVLTPKDDKDIHKRGALHSAGNFRATVYYRGGKEIVQEEGTQEHGLITRGTFGPILRTVILDAAHSATTQWGRWEAGPNGSIAVFRFQVPQTESHYEIAESGVLGMMDPTAYHGAIGIDPNSGTILRLVLEADPALGSSIQSSDIMVEYGEVAIGGKAYICPVRSVSYAVGAPYVLTTLDVPTSWNGKAARLNDVVFDNYHVFRSDVRIVP